MNLQAMERMVRKGAGVALYMFGAVWRAKEAVRLYNNLDRMDDDELAEIGLTREQIGRHVAESMDPVTLSTIGEGRPADLPSLPVEAALQRRAA